MKIKNENEKQESKTNIENENQNQESNLKMENESQDWNFDNVIWWLYINGYTLDAISNLIGFLKIEEAELKRDKANYKNTLRLISKITNDNTIKDIVSDTISDK